MGPNGSKSPKMALWRDYITALRNVCNKKLDSSFRKRQGKYKLQMQLEPATKTSTTSATTNLKAAKQPKKT
jgi:hypothetical protein